MNKWIKYSSTIAISGLVAFSGNAQDTKSSSKKSEEIIIRLNENNPEKMTIVIDGDNITVNGKAISDIKGANVRIFKREKATSGSDFREKTYYTPRSSFDGENYDRFIPSGVNKAMLGVVTTKTPDGVRITDVTKASGAEKAGLKKDDIITKIAGTQITDTKALTEAISKFSPNDKVDITYKRDGKEQKATATLGENKSKSWSFNMDNEHLDFDMHPMPGKPGEAFGFHFNRKPKIGMQIQDVEEGKGVKVKDVDDDTPAFKAGLKEGDVITQVNGKEIAGVDELRDQIKDLKEGDSVKVSYNRDGKSQTTDVRIPKRLKTADL